MIAWIRCDGVVPVWQSFVLTDAESVKLVSSGCGTGWVKRAIEIGVYFQAGFRLGGTKELKDLFIIGQGLTGPVLGDL